MLACGSGGGRRSAVLGTYVLASTWMALFSCSSGMDSAGFTAGDAGTDGSGDGADESGVTGVTGSATTDTADTTGGENGDSGSEGSGGTDGAPNDDCVDVDCGGNGSCRSSDAGPVCDCDDGYAPLGTQCIKCSAPSNYDLDLDLVTGTLAVTINDAQPPTSEYEDAVLSLRDPLSGDTVALGNTHDGPLSFAALPGTYDLVYEHESGAAILPVNTSARLGKVELVAGVAYDDTVPIPVGRVTGTITIANEAPPATEFDQGRLWLRRPDIGDAVLLGSTMFGTYDVLVAPGTYEIHYEHVAGANVPANADAFLGVVDVSPLGEVPDHQDIDVPMIHLSGPITVGGLDAPDSAYENGRLSLQGPLAGDLMHLGETRDQAYSIHVVPGVYDVVYEWVAGAAIVPANAHARFFALGADADLQQPLDVPVATVSGAFSIDESGTPPPADPTDDGNLFLRSSGDSVYLGNTAYGSYERRLIPGTYDVYFSQDSSRGGVPKNTNARIAEAAMVSDKGLDVQILSVQVQGQILVAGQPPPASDYDDGHIYLRDPDTLDSVLLANTRESGFAATVVPGVYDIVYAAETPGGQVPVNAGAVIGTVDVSAMPVFDVDVPVMQVGGSISVDGATPPQDPANVGLMFFVDAQTLDPVYLGSTMGAAYGQRVTPGDYLVFYRVQSSTGLVPANANANLGCWTVQ